MTISKLLTISTNRLKDVGISSARLDTLILLEDMIKKDRSWVLAHGDHELNNVQARRLLRKIERRATHVPLAYIRGHTEFYGRKFKVNRHVLEPRPESETMIELLKQLLTANARLQGLDGVQGAGERRTGPYLTYGKGAAQPATTQSAKSRGGFRLSWEQAGAALSIADIGTGNGAIGITAALEFPGSTVDLYEISSGALAVAKHNIHLHELHIHARKMNLLSRPLRPYDVIMANLPYVPDHWEINQAAMAEPRIAIFGGPDGLNLYRKLFHQLERFTWKPRYVLTESLPPQHENLARIASQYGFKLIQSEDFIQVFSP